MNVFVAGSTGVLGRRVVDRLVDRGHDVTGLVRDDASAALVRELGGRPRFGDVLERETLLEAAEGADVVIHAATAIPTEGKPSADDWKRNDRIRTEGTRNLLAAADAVGADRFLLQSVVWVARRPDGDRFDENSPPNPDRTTGSALEAERLLESAVESGETDLEGVTLRCGWFYAHDSAQTRQFGERLLDGKMPIVGGGLLGRADATLSFCHADDAAAAFVAATEGDATGLFHVVDDRPTKLGEFTRTFADQIEAPSPRRVPGWLARPLIGADAVRFLTSGMPTANDRFREAFDWEPDLPTVDAGLERVVSRWLEEGRLRPADDGYEWVDEPSERIDDRRTDRGSTGQRQGGDVRSERDSSA